jgi:branched-chain amino acid transport system ATP-binding protein
MLETLLGGRPGVFLGVTVVLLGGAAWLMGRAVAEAWKPRWQVLPYGVLLGLACRFLRFALFGDPLLAPLGILVDTAVLIAIGALAWQIAFAAKMVRQYPWLYEPDGILGWRPIAGTRDG